MKAIRYGLMLLLASAVLGAAAVAQDMNGDMDQDMDQEMGEDMNGGMAMEMASATLMLGQHDVFGEYLTDGEGRALYVVVDDAGEPVDCTGECADAWPPLLADEATAGMGVSSDMLGTVQREDGSMQVTYAGHPVYYFVNDVEPGQVNCQAVAQFGGTWYVLYGDGEINTTSPE